MCLINVAHEHLTAQTGKKSKPALINVIGPGAEGPRGRRPRAEGREKQILFKNYEVKLRTLN